MERTLAVIRDLVGSMANPYGFLDEANVSGVEQSVYTGTAPFNLTAARKRQIRNVAPHLPRWFDLTDEQLAPIIEENAFSLVDHDWPDYAVTLEIAVADRAGLTLEVGELDLAELTIASAIVSELALRVATGSRPFGVDRRPGG